MGEDDSLFRDYKGHENEFWTSISEQRSIWFSAISSMVSVLMTQFSAISQARRLAKANITFLEKTCVSLCITAFVSWVFLWFLGVTIGYRFDNWSSLCNVSLSILFIIPIARKWTIDVAWFLNYFFFIVSALKSSTIAEYPFFFRTVNTCYIMPTVTINDIEVVCLSKCHRCMHTSKPPALP